MIRKWIRRMIAEELEENALEYVNHDEIAESIDLQALAGHVDVYDVAREMDACDIAEHVDAYDVANELDIDRVAKIVYDAIREKKEEEE